MTNNSIIQYLPDDVIEKIAAGEVVENPASVVKELVENAIDADASRIDIEISNGGMSLIRITDDGTGMNEEDIKKAPLRHCTSKIKTADDLYKITTMGFRGEALASIASVSRMTIYSCNNLNGSGYKLNIEAGEIKDFSATRHIRGTTIEVKDLFYNVPARKKFLKSENSEKNSVLRYFEQLVIPFVGIHFTLIVDGKKKADYPPVKSVKERIAQVAGIEFTSKLVEFKADFDNFSVWGYITDPQNAKARPRFRYLYVNLRRIDSDPVSAAVTEAFSRFIVSSLKPAWFCFLDIDPAKIDVNVHPTKQVIKFDNSKEIFSAVFHAVYDGISAGIKKDLDIETNSTKHNPSAEKTYTQKKIISINNYQNEIRESLYDYVPSRETIEESKEGMQIPIPFVSVLENKNKNFNEKVEENNVQLEKDENWNLISCYQVHKTYIIAHIKNGIMVIDQHAAHERILYEEALRDLKSGKNESQRLLFPIIFDLTAEEKDIVINSREYFYKLGFDIQDFGGKSIAVSSVPASGFLEVSDVETALREMIKNIIEEKDKEILSQPEKHFAASFACGAAIKAGKELTQEEMNMLIHSLFAAENPYICPHGRPTVVRISMNELSKRFLRS